MKSFKEELQAIKEQCNSGVVKQRIEVLASAFRSKPVILYGAGTLSTFVMNNLSAHNVQVECFCDTFRSGVHQATGLPIISAEQLKSQYSDAIVIVTSELHGASILSTLQQIEYPGKIYSFDELLPFYTIPYNEFEPHEDGYQWAYEYFTDMESKQIVLDSMRTRLLGTRMTPSPNHQYFEPDACPLTDSEIFVDGGCFIGDTAEEFIRQTSGKYDYIYGFEPDMGNLKKALANLAQYKNIDVINGGLWHMTNTCKFVSGAFGNSQLSEDGDTITNTFSLDEFFADKQAPTFIKMDIEGAEYCALEGAKGILETCKPKLAICVYHQIHDIYALPQQILKINPEYKLALRHYSRWYAESVCYAV
ncbi:FkbM family methyltransferase [Desulfitobacterium sp. LBE]|uniref:FkbM family methyltransferase n=1 Tax=Desulfitobacterium sp. LBE TaxID=884086 RepID=UPI00119C211F|nr:FkbM family methyltransferase [Desulfitobacterium sp. LBE]TWH60039.1 FkbM family methyltransferase [Desulfitobacterium sp. LBE]